MVKSVTLITKKPGISRDDFIQHYEEVHVPLTLKHFCFDKYIRNYVIPSGVEETKYDCITEIWFKNLADYHACISFWQSEDGHELRVDEFKFIDRNKSIYFFVEEKATV